MSPTVLETIANWSSVQSLLHNSADTDISFKWPFARRMLTATMTMYRWFRNHNSALKTLGLENGEMLWSTSSQLSLFPNKKAGRRLGMLPTDDLELLEATDVGGEETSDLEAEIGMVIEHDEVSPQGVENGANSDDESVGVAPNV
jgi:hypothetical protein